MEVMPNGWSGNGVGVTGVIHVSVRMVFLVVPKCGGEIDCIDDPEDILAQYGFRSELAILGCDADLSDFME